MNKASGESVTSAPPSAAGASGVTEHHGATPQGKLLYLLALGALGVVYGDIGTSPLYALRECFNPEHHLEPTERNVFGVLSLIVWSLTLIVTIKYLSFVLRADHRGEGGILALMSLAFPERKTRSRGVAGVFVLFGIFGAALLYGDGMITPAITVLGAIEGLEVATPAFKAFVVPISVMILVALFAVQRIGTGNVGNVFGPIMIIWFLSIGALGIFEIVRAPDVLGAVNPMHAVDFLRHAKWQGFVVLGAVFLVVTGSEALYADMGHFGRKPIRMAWFALVFPALLLNYFGQGALLLRNPDAASNPFFRLAPSWALYPLVAIATAAAIIASQALISGAFSLTMQAIQLGYSPRMKMEHTSSSTRGQIYIPYVNWALMFACIGLVIGFQNSSNLAAAYGIAVTLTMLITTALFYVAERRLWGWSRWVALPLCGLFFFVEFAFFGANCLKIAHGGWFPLVMGTVVFTVMVTWKTGRRILGERLRGSMIPLSLFLDDVEQHAPHRVAGTAVFMSSNAEFTPLALLHNLKHNRVLHQRVVFLTIITEDAPFTDATERVEIENLCPGAEDSGKGRPDATDQGVKVGRSTHGHGFYRVIARYGYMESANVPEILQRAEALGLKADPMNTTFFLSRETIIPTKMPGMAIWRERLFAFLSRNAQRPTDFFGIPANRVVELGMQVEM